MFDLLNGYFDWWNTCLTNQWGECQTDGKVYGDIALMLSLMVGGALWGCIAFNLKVNGKTLSVKNKTRIFVVCYPILFLYQYLILIAAIAAVAALMLYIMSPDGGWKKWREQRCRTKLLTAPVSKRTDLDATIKALEIECEIIPKEPEREVDFTELSW